MLLELSAEVAVRLKLDQRIILIQTLNAYLEPVAVFDLMARISKELDSADSSNLLAYVDTIMMLGFTRVLQRVLLKSCEMRGVLAER